MGGLNTGHTARNPLRKGTHRHRAYGTVQGSRPRMSIAGGGAPPPHAPPPANTLLLHCLDGAVCPLFMRVAPPSKSKVPTRGGHGGAEPPHQRMTCMAWTVPYALCPPPSKARCPLRGVWGGGAPPSAIDMHCLDGAVCPLFMRVAPPSKSKVPARGGGAPPPANVESLRRGFHIAARVSGTGPVCPSGTDPRHA